MIMKKITLRFYYRSDHYLSMLMLENVNRLRVDRDKCDIELYDLSLREKRKSYPCIEYINHVPQLAIVNSRGCHIHENWEELGASEKEEVESLVARMTK